MQYGRNDSKTAEAKGFEYTFALYLSVVQQLYKVFRWIFLRKEDCVVLIASARGGSHFSS